MTPMGKISHYVIYILFVLCSASLASAGEQSAYADTIAKKVIQETAAQHAHNIQSALGFSNPNGRTLGAVVNIDDIEKIFIPYQSSINAEQITYLLYNAVFSSRNKPTHWHTAHRGSFQIILRNYTLLGVHFYGGAPFIRVTAGTDEYWLEIPDYKTFRALGPE